VDVERGGRERLRIIDTEGVESSPDTVPAASSIGHWLALVDAVVLVYAVDDERSFEVAEALKREVDKHTVKEKKELVVVALANKTDVGGTKRRVEGAKGLHWATKEKVDTNRHFSRFISKGYGDLL